MCAALAMPFVRVDASTSSRASTWIRFASSSTDSTPAGGGTWLFDDGLAPRVRMLLVIGYEGPEARSTLITGAEVGVGGGLRIGVTIRPARDAAR